MIPRTLLRWSVALVLGSQAGALIISIVRGEHIDAPIAAALALGVVELVAAVVFLVPRAVAVGGVALLATLVAAAIVHLVLGKAPPASFAVYAAALWVVIDGSSGQPARA
jgi:hypothetical protein